MDYLIPHVDEMPCFGCVDPCGQCEREVMLVSEDTANIQGGPFDGTEIRPFRFLIGDIPTEEYE